MNKKELIRVAFLRYAKANKPLKGVGADPRYQAYQKFMALQKKDIQDLINEGPAKAKSIDYDSLEDGLKEWDQGLKEFAQALRDGDDAKIDDLIGEVHHSDWTYDKYKRQAEPVLEKTRLITFVG